MNIEILKYMTNFLNLTLDKNYVLQLFTEDLSFF